MKTIQMRRMAPCALVSTMMMATVACTGTTEAWSDDELDRVEAAEQALPTDGQVCITVQQGTSGQVEDATLWQSAPTWNDQDNERISTGTSVEGGYSRSLLRFDLSAVPAEANVGSAELKLVQNDKNGPSATINVLRATADWSEGTVTWSSFGDAFDPNPAVSFTAEGDGWFGERTVDVRALAQAWVSGDAPNYGVVIDAPTDETRSEFRSSESPQSGERPALTVCYTTCNDGVQNGEETGVDCGGPSCDSCNQSGSFSYSASNTSYATRNTTDRPLSLQAGKVIVMGTCGLPGSWASGDTYLRLIGPTGLSVAANDDNCGSLSSYLTYTVPSGAGGTYVMRAGCYSSYSCSGNVVYMTY